MMKTFKKRHEYLPALATIKRLVYRGGKRAALERYEYQLNHQTSALIPFKIRQTTLARPNPNKRMEIQYFPDLRTFLGWEQPNRSLPIAKFFDLFRGMLPQEELDTAVEAMSGYRMVLATSPDDWLAIYDDENVDSCMTGKEVVRCYAHPENHLALAALYPPGEDYVIARTIVNTRDKWYVRLFGDPLLVEKLREEGYRKMCKPPSEFKMYAYWNIDKVSEGIKLPYFDMFGHGGGKMQYQVLPDTYCNDTNLVEIIVNPGVN